MDVNPNMNLDPVGQMEPCKRGSHEADWHVPVERFASAMSGIDCLLRLLFYLVSGPGSCNRPVEYPYTKELRTGHS
jgi:hypothetical protein